MAYVDRLIDPLLARLLASVPAVFLTGPRATGKTTSAMRLAHSVVRLDRPAEAAAFLADPDAALRGLAEPVLIDEWQLVPRVLGAIKRSVDQDPRPGRFLVTGSVRSSTDPGLWPGTGRLVRIPMYGLTVRELEGHARSPGFLDRLVAGDPLPDPVDPPDLQGYVGYALRGGFPDIAFEPDPVIRRLWLDSYVESMLERDVPMVDRERDPGRMRRYLEAYALNSAGIVDDVTLLQAAGINRRTGVAYERALTDLGVVEALPAWTSNRLKRLVLSPKRYLVDPAFLGSLLGVEVRDVMRDGDVLGRLLDTLVMSQLRPETVLSEARPRVYHLRQEQGRFEVDVIAEMGFRRIVALEVKADAAPGVAAARHLIKLRDELGPAFVAGVVLHTGPRTYQLAERVVAVPIATIWDDARQDPAG